MKYRFATHPNDMIDSNLTANQLHHNLQQGANCTLKVGETTDS